MTPSRNDGLISRYEELRRQALGRQSGVPRGQGLVLLMRSGMRVWMQAWAKCIKDPPVKRQDRPLGEQIIPLDMRNEVAMILTTMVLYGRRKEMV
jgi:hypothetical protein